MKHLSIIGSTGSIGRQTLDVVRQHKDEFAVSAIVAHSNVDVIEAQVKEFNPQFIGLVDEVAYKELKRRLPHKTIYGGKEALLGAAQVESAQMVVTAIVGAAGIEPTIRAIEKGKDIALANKETLVAGGHLITDLCKKKQVSLLPVDSEHSALFQCLEGQNRHNVDKLIITASGGPLRDWSREDLDKATAADCLRHPTWSMGNKITIDSSTLFNKGLEVIEAHWLFGFDYDHIDVVVHPQSIVHSMIRMKDGAILAQLGNPDMREPIQYALTYPKRLPLQIEHLDFTKGLSLTFMPPRYDDFPALSLAFEVGRAGGFKPAVFNAANEIAVYAFLENKISFRGIYDTVYRVLSQMPSEGEFTLDRLLAVDQWARDCARSIIR